MSMLKEKLRDAFDYTQFTATLGVFSVTGIEMLQRTMERYNLAPLHNLSDNPMNVSMLAAATGVSVGNSFLQDFSTRNCLPHVVYSTIIGFLCGTAAENMAASPYIAAFAGAASGMALRRNLVLHETIDDARSRRRDYDDFDY